MLQKLFYAIALGWFDFVTAFLAPFRTPAQARRVVDREAVRAERDLDRKLYRDLAETVTARLLEAQKTQAESFAAAITAVAAEQGKSAGLLQEWLKGFQVHDIPSSHAVTDQDEVGRLLERQAREQMEMAGLDADASPAETLHWLSQTIDADLANEARASTTLGVDRATLRDTMAGMTAAIKR